MKTLFPQAANLAQKQFELNDNVFQTLPKIFIYKKNMAPAWWRMWSCDPSLVLNQENQQNCRLQIICIRDKQVRQYLYLYLFTQQNYLLEWVWLKPELGWANHKLLI